MFRPDPRTNHRSEGCARRSGEIGIVIVRDVTCLSSPRQYFVTCGYARAFRYCEPAVDDGPGAAAFRPRSDGLVQPGSSRSRWCSSWRSLRRACNNCAIPMTPTSRSGSRRSTTGALLTSCMAKWQHEVTEVGGPAPGEPHRVVVRVLHEAILALSNTSGQAAPWHGDRSCRRRTGRRAHRPAAAEPGPDAPFRHRWR